MKTKKRWAYRSGPYVWVINRTPKKDKRGRLVPETHGTSLLDFQWRLIFGAVPPEGKVTPIEVGMGSKAKRKKVKKKARKTRRRKKGA